MNQESKNTTAPALLLLVICTFSLPAYSQDRPGPFSRPDRGDPFCSAPNYRSDTRILFPEERLYTVKTQDFLMTAERREAVFNDLGHKVIPFDMLGKHLMYFPVTRDVMPLGLMHVRRLFSSQGMTTVGWRMDFDFNLVDFYVAGRDVGIPDVLSSKEELLSAIQKTDKLKMLSWLDEKDILLTDEGVADLGLEKATKSQRETTALVIYFGALSQSCAQVLYSEDEPVLLGYDATLRELRERTAALRALPQAVQERISDIRPVPDTLLTEACNAVKAGKPMMEDLKCEISSASSLSMRDHPKARWTLQSSMQLAGASRAVRWFIDTERRVISVQPAGSALPTEDSELRQLLDGIQAVVAEPRLWSEEECMTGSQVVVYQVQELVRELELLLQ